jgi:hypothetical protein
MLVRISRTSDQNLRTNMTIINQKVPFIWPSPPLHEEPSIYQQSPPFGDLVLAATWLFGVVPALTSRGIQVLEDWLEGNVDLKVSIVVVVYPACAAQQADLDRLRATVRGYANRVFVRILPLEQVTDRSINVLCFSAKESDSITMAIGPSENLGLDPWGRGHLNFLFRADPPLMEVFRTNFDSIWASAFDVETAGATEIPDLILPGGSVEAAQAWRSYLNEIRSAPPDIFPATTNDLVIVESGDHLAQSPDTEAIQSPTEQLGIRALDPLGAFMADLYNKGSLVSIDKLSKIPPLDAPLAPNLFGDSSELRSGSVTRKVNMRVSVIDDKTLKALEACRSALRTLLTKFTFGLADNMRWMPNLARKLFEAELARANEEGLKLISDLLKGDLDAFLRGKREKLVFDLNEIYLRLGKPGHLTPEIIDKVIESLRVRLTKAQQSDFMPKITYSSISFSSTEGPFSSPWAQAYSLLSDIAAFPRKANTDSFFFRGVKTSRQELLSAMDVLSDAILCDSKTFEVEDRSKLELALLAAIERAAIDSKTRCTLVRQIIEGAPASGIQEELAEQLGKNVT